MTRFPNSCRSVFMLKIFSVTALVISVSTASAEQWPQFRGPNASGVVPDNAQLPLRWSESENISWRTPIPGLGWSSPVVASNMVFLTTVVSDGNVEAPEGGWYRGCLLYTSPSPRDGLLSRMPSSA